MPEATAGRSYSGQCQEFINGWKDRACGAGREALTDILVKAFKDASTVQIGNLRAKNSARFAAGKIELAGSDLPFD